MRALIQRVGRAAVTVDGEQISAIGPGMVVLLGVAPDDGEPQVESLARKIRALRIFADADGRMNEAIGDREILCVSQFTLYADTGRGNRPSFTGAAEPELAKALYESFCESVEAKRGSFGAHMELELLNDGPVTLMLEA